MEHAFITCDDYNQRTGDAVTLDLSRYLASILMEKILRLELGELPEEMELPVVWFSAAFIFFTIRAEIEGKIAPLK